MANRESTRAIMSSDVLELSVNEDIDSSLALASAGGLEMSASENLSDYERKPSHASEDFDSFQPGAADGSKDDGEDVEMHDETMDKVKLRKIKQKLKRSQNRRKKKLLTKNLKNFSASALQQSVADLAGGLAGNRDEPFGVTSSFPNDFYAQRNGGTEDAHGQDFQPLSWPNGNSAPIMSEEATVLVMDADNVSYRLSALDLSVINEWLEKSMYKDLALTPKLKINNSFLSSTKQVWVVCQTPYAANWVIQKVKEMKITTGRRYSACLAGEISCLTAVNMFIPKECGFVDSYSTLMRFLLIHNPSLAIGTTREASQSAKSRISFRNDTSINENSSQASQEQEHDSNLLAENSEFKNCELLPEKTSPPAATEQAPSTSCFDFSDLEAPRRARTITFFADDMWLQELKLLAPGPFLGLRRLPYVLGDTIVMRTGERVPRVAEKALSHSKNFRGSGGGRNRRRKPARDNTNLNASAPVEPPASSV